MGEDNNSRNDNLTSEVLVLQPNLTKLHNKIRTSKYTMHTFLFITLYELLWPTKRIANFYFLVVSMLQMVKSVR